MQHKIYLMRCVINDETFYKIGRTKKSVRSRINELQTGNPAPIEYIYEFETKNPHLLESSLHNYFSQYRVKGEWFSSELSVKKFKEYCDTIEKNLNQLFKNQHDLPFL